MSDVRGEMSEGIEGLSRRTVLAAGGSAAVGGGWLGAARSEARRGRNQRARSLRVVDALYRSLQDKNLDAFAALWSEDAVWWAPVTAEGGPGETVGSEAIVDLLRGAFEVFSAVNFTWELEPMLDPRAVLANWTLDNELRAGGFYRNRGVAIVRLRDGLITRFAEHFDTAAWIEVFAPQR